MSRTSETQETHADKISCDGCGKTIAMSNGIKCRSCGAITPVTVLLRLLSWPHEKLEQLRRDRKERADQLQWDLIEQTLRKNSERLEPFNAEVPARIKWSTEDDNARRFAFTKRIRGTSRAIYFSEAAISWIVAAGFAVPYETWIAINLIFQIPGIREVWVDQDEMIIIKAEAIEWSDVFEKLIAALKTAYYDGQEVTVSATA